MDAQQAQSKFQQADVLFKKGRPQEALAVLCELEAAFPNTRNILYPKALCLEKLGRTAEAAQVCDVLVRQFQDPRAQALMNQMQVAASAAPVIPGLDGLDFDLMQPAASAFAPPKAAAAAPAQGGGRKTWLILAIAGVVLALGAAGVTGARLGLFAGGASKLQQLETRLKDTFDASGSFTGVLDASFPMPDPRIPMTITFGGTIEYLQKDNHVYFRIEGAPSASGGVPLPSMAMKMVSNGEEQFLEMNIGGQTMVVRVPMSAAGAMQPSPAAIFAVLRENFDIKSLPDAKVGGKDVWVFDLTPKPGTVPDTSAMPIPAPQLDRARVSCAGDDLSYFKLEALDAAGASQLSVALLNVRVNAPLSPEQFAYAPPAGAQVMEMSDLAGGGMLPMLMGGAGGG